MFCWLSARRAVTKAGAGRLSLATGGRIAAGRDRRAATRRAPSAGLPAQDEDPLAGEHPARADDHTDVRAIALGCCFATHLAYSFKNGEHSVHARVGVRQPAAVGIERQAAPGLGVALGDKRPGLALGTKPSASRP